MAQSSQSECLTLLSRLLLQPSVLQDHRPEAPNRCVLPEKQRREFLSLANSHHVIVRALQVLQRMSLQAGNAGQADWTQQALTAERKRISDAIPVLAAICARFDAVDCDIAVIKSLDHWPDLGSDLDLFTSALPASVVRIMTEDFHARCEKRSWGDRLANKWNFAVPGLRELVEIHVGRLGQTGEQVMIADSLISRATMKQVGSHTFRVASAQDRLIITTLQRMYRHFYLRLCDIVDTTELLETGLVDYSQLRSRSEIAGIWKGVATFLSLVSGYVERYRGQGLGLPTDVVAESALSADRLTFNAGFLRVPIVPHSVKLYANELGQLLRNGELRGTVRLSLLPGLATAAAVGVKITGSDKGIW